MARSKKGGADQGAPTKIKREPPPAIVTHHADGTSDYLLPEPPDQLEPGQIADDLRQQDLADAADVELTLEMPTAQAEAVFAALEAAPTAAEVLAAIPDAEVDELAGKIAAGLGSLVGVTFPGLGTVVEDTGIVEVTPTDEVTKQRQKRSARNAAKPPEPERAPPIHATIPLSQITENAKNPRRTFAQGPLEELVASIKAHGVMQPVVVRRLDDKPIVGPDARFELIAGARRWRASAIAGQAAIPARIVDVDEGTALELMATENLQREDLDPIEEAECYWLLVKERGLTMTEVADRLGLHRATVSNQVRLLELPDDVQKLLQDGQLSRAHGVSLLRFKEHPDVLRWLAKRVIENQWASKALDGWQLADHTYELVNAGLARSLSGYEVAFDTAVCNACPFGARLALGDRYGAGKGHCLRPAEFDAKQEAALEAKRQATLAQVAAAVAAEAKAVRPLDTVGLEASMAADKRRKGAKAAAAEIADLAATAAPTEEAVEAAAKLAGYPKYTTLKHAIRIGASAVPTGCGDHCPCRTLALDYGGTELISVCLDEKRYQRLKTADTKLGNKGHRAEGKALLTALEAEVASWDEAPARAIALLARLAISQVHVSEAVNGAVDHVLTGKPGGDPRGKVTAGPRVYSSYPGLSLKEIGQLEPLDAVKLAVEAVCRERLARHLAQPPHDLSEVRWILASPPPPAPAPVDETDDAGGDSVGIGAEEAPTATLAPVDDQPAEAEADPDGDDPFVPVDGKLIRASELTDAEFDAAVVDAEAAELDEWDRADAAAAAADQVDQPAAYLVDVTPADVEAAVQECLADISAAGWILQAIEAPYAVFHAADGEEIRLALYSGAEGLRNTIADRMAMAAFAAEAAAEAAKPPSLLGLLVDLGEAFAAQGLTVKGITRGRVELTDADGHVVSRTKMLVAADPDGGWMVTDDKGAPIARQQRDG